MESPREDVTRGGSPRLRRGFSSVRGSTDRWTASSTEYLCRSTALLSQAFGHELIHCAHGSLECPAPLAGHHRMARVRGALPGPRQRRRRQQREDRRLPGRRGRPGRSHRRRGAVGAQVHRAGADLRPAGRPGRGRREDRRRGRREGPHRPVRAAARGGERGRAGAVRGRRDPPGRGGPEGRGAGREGQGRRTRRADRGRAEGEPRSALEETGSPSISKGVDKQRGEDWRSPRRSPSPSR